MTDKRLEEIREHVEKYPGGSFIGFEKIKVLLEIVDTQAEQIKDGLGIVEEYYKHDDDGWQESFIQEVDAWLKEIADG